MSATTIEWAIQYPGEDRPHRAESEWRARSWAAYWNDHRIRLDDGEAVVMSRTVTTSEWTEAPSNDEREAT